MKMNTQDIAVFNKFFNDIIDSVKGGGMGDENSPYKAKEFIVDSNGDLLLLCEDRTNGEEFDKYVGDPESVTAIKNLAMMLIDNTLDIDENTIEGVFYRYFVPIYKKYNSGIGKKMFESVDSVNVDSVYKYQPSYNLGDFLSDARFPDEVELQELANSHLSCKVVDKVVLSDEDEGMIIVTFDIPENEGKLPDFAVDKTFIVFNSDLLPMGEEVNEGKMRIKESDSFESFGYMDQSLLLALNSEREAVALYETLLNNTDSVEAKEVLKSILDDEKEHIALLSSLQTSETASFVEDEDDKKVIKDNAEDTVEIVNEEVSDSNDDDDGGIDEE